MAGSEEVEDADDHKNGDLCLARKLVVRKEKKRRRGKTVTVITGLRQSDLQDLTKTLKKALGCGATLEAENLVLQGDLVKRVIDWLESKGAKHVKAG